MSQQINLLLPELRPRFDWLALPVVAGIAAAGLLLLLALAQVQSFRIDRQKAAEADLNGQLLNMQQQVQTLGQSLAARVPSASLPIEIAALRTGVAQRQEVLAFVGRSDGGAAPGFANMLQGFARQSIDGVWLVGFGLAGNDVEIRGRLLDPARLPVYIDRLNDDAAFTGRRFSALEMKAVDPAAEPRDTTRAEPARTAPGGRFTEFMLRTETVPVTEKAP